MISQKWQNNEDIDSLLMSMLFADRCSYTYASLNLQLINLLLVDVILRSSNIPAEEVHFHRPSTEIDTGFISTWIPLELVENVETPELGVSHTVEVHVVSIVPSFAHVAVPVNGDIVQSNMYDAWSVRLPDSCIETWPLYRIEKRTSTVGNHENYKNYICPHYEH